MSEEISLVKGGKISLEKEDGTGLSKIHVGLGWDAKDSAASGAEFDLDASVFMLNASGKCRGKGDFVFFNNLKSGDGSVVHEGDNLTGEGEGDDEVVKIDLTKVDAEIEKIVVVVNIYQAVQRNQNFGIVENSFMRIEDDTNQNKIAKFDLNFDASVATGVTFGTLIKRDGKWVFSAEQTEFEGGLAALKTKYGLS